MDDGGVINSILRGTFEGEGRLDVLHMCFVAATARMEHKGQRPGAVLFYRNMAIIGEILCPIFSPVKPPDYVRNMIEKRREFAGIATDPGLQADYAEAINILAIERLLDSVRVAVDAQIWRRLGRRALPL